VAIIDDFVKCYKSQYSEYDMIRKRVESVIEKNLRDSGIMAITSSRVKDAGRLREKLLLRQKDTPYNTFEDIENDIVDFVGVRIALYFPNDQKKVDSLIYYLFDVEKTRPCLKNKPQLCYFNKTMIAAI
jgi:ppGpp synthetase/RelA/SpoT-type nucleotidyltranferase